MMTPVRRLAVAISKFVVRYASFGCKEWAEGLAREVEFVEGDWAALRWAIGSVKVLFDRRPSPMASLGEVEFHAKRFAKTATGWPYYLPIFSFNYLLQLFSSQGVQQRVGCLLAVISSVFLAWMSLLKKQAAAEPPGEEDARVWAMYYRSELERSIEYFRSPFAISYPFGVGFWILGAMLSLNGNMSSHLYWNGTFALLYAWAVALFFRRKRMLQRHLGEVDAVLRQGRQEYPADVSGCGL